MPLMVSADIVEVAKVAADEVAMYRFPPAALKVQLEEVVALSERASWTPVLDATVSMANGVVVPMPTRVLVPPLVYMAFGKEEEVEVAHLEEPEEEMVMGEEPRTLKPVQVVRPEQVTEVVATPATPAPPVE